jgi:hypothetical protein
MWPLARAAGVEEVSGEKAAGQVGSVVPRAMEIGWLSGDATFDQHLGQRGVVDEVAARRMEPFAVHPNARIFKASRQTRLRVRPDRRCRRQSPPARNRRKGTQNQAIGKSRGGLTTKTTKLVALVDARGNIARFVLLPGSATAQLLLLQPGSNYPLITLRLPVARDRCDVRRNGPAGLLWFPTRHATLRRGRTISLAVERW